MENLPGASLAIGPLNTAGQARLWARAAHTVLSIPAWSFSGSIGAARAMTGAADRRLPHHRLAPQWTRSLVARKIVRRASHLLAESCSPILSKPGRNRLGDDLQRLRDLGLTVAVVFHGSDIRNPDRHIGRIQNSYFLDASTDWRRSVGNDAIANATWLQTSGLASFYSTPDLVFDLPNSTWLPVTIETERWENTNEVLQRRIPVVIHVPSRRNPPIKGTHHIDPVLTKMDQEGLIRYISPTSVAHSKMPDLVMDADIVVDQITTGLYGVASAEAMAAGRLVVGYVASDTRAAMPEPPPIVDAPPTQFETIIRSIVGDPDQYRQNAADGPNFAKRWHDGTAAAHALSSFVSVSGNEF